MVDTDRTPKANRETLIEPATYAVALTWGNDLDIPAASQVPADIVEAVMQVETGGDLLGCEPHCPWQGNEGSSAVWPMNVMPDGIEAGAWEDITGIPFQQTIPQFYPADITDNIAVGVLGLASDRQRVIESTGNPNPSWYDVGLAYFTGDSDPSTALSKSDGYNTGSQYRNALASYVKQNYGNERSDALFNGEWETRTVPTLNEGGCSASEWASNPLKCAGLRNPVDYAKDAADKVTDIYDWLVALPGMIEDNLPRIALVIGGLAVIIGGVALIVKSYTPMGMALEQAT